MSGDTDKLADVEAWARDSLSVATIVRARDVTTDPGPTDMVFGSEC